MSYKMESQHKEEYPIVSNNLAYNGGSKALGSWRLASLYNLQGTEQSNIPKDKWRFDYLKEWNNPLNKSFHIWYYCWEDNPKSIAYNNTNVMAITGKGTMMELWQSSPEEPSLSRLRDTIILIEVKDSHVHWGNPTEDAEVCFVTGTPILMTDGTSKPIEQIHPGDMVLSVDHNDLEHDTPKAAKVTRFFDNGLKSVVKLTFKNQETKEQFEVVCKLSHRFYVIAKGWTTAENLQNGAQCQSANDEQTTFLSRESLDDQQHVYNFEVNEKHTYFVGTTNSASVLVHNICSDDNYVDDVFQSLDQIGSYNIWDMHRALNPNCVLKQEQRMKEQIVADYNNAFKASILIASIILPGPEDLVWAAVSSKYGIKLAGNVSERFLTRNGVKLVGNDLEEAVNTVLRYKIAEHAYMRNHFPKKSIDEIENFIKSTIDSGKSIPGPQPGSKRIMYYDSRTKAIVVFDG